MEDLSTTPTAIKNEMIILTTLTDNVGNTIQMQRGMMENNRVMEDTIRDEVQFPVIM